MLLESDASGVLMQLLIFGGLLAIGYILLIRPARIKQRELQEFQNALKPGDRVMTRIGIYGTVIDLGENQAILEVAPGVRITIAKEIIGKIVTDEEEEYEYEDEEVQVEDSLTSEESQN